MIRQSFGENVKRGRREKLVSWVAADDDEKLTRRKKKKKVLL